MWLLCVDVFDIFFSCTGGPVLRFGLSNIPALSFEGSRAGTSLQVVSPNDDWL